MIYLISAILLFSNTLSAEKYLKVGDTEISFSSIKTIKQGKSYMSPIYAKMTEKEFVEELKDFYLIVNEAKKQKIDKKEIAQYLMDQALYNFYIRDEIQTKIKASKITSIQLRKFYRKYPTIKFSRLVIFFPPNDRNLAKKAYSKLSVIRGQLVQKAITFKKALKRFDKRMKNMNGTFDKMAFLDLPPQEQAILGALKVGEYSPLVKEANFVAIYKINKKYKYSSIKDKKNLRFKYVYMKTQEVLKNKIKDLKKKNKANIAIINK